MALNGIDSALIQEFHEFEVLLNEGLRTGELATSFSYLYFHKNRQFAKACFEKLLSTVSPLILREYLETTDKPEWLLSEQLIVLLDHPATKGSDEWQMVVLTLAQNAYWCRTLGYATFLKYCHQNLHLADYIATETFLLHLEPYHVGEFLREHPNYSNDVLDSLLSIQAEGSKQAWVDGVLKCIVKHVCAQNFKVEKYKAFVTRLHELFASDRFFAKMVLKNTDLCTQWIGHGKMVAYKHPLFTNADFEELSAFFERNRFVSIARQYREFANLSPLPLACDNDDIAEYASCQEDGKATSTFRIETMFPEFKRLVKIDVVALENHQTENTLQEECLTPRPAIVSSTQMKRISKSHSLQDLLLESDQQMQALESQVEKLKFG